MDQSRRNKPEGAPACAQNADAGAPLGGAGPERRFSAQRKLAAVTRLLRGEPLEGLVPHWPCGASVIRTSGADPLLPAPASTKAPALICAPTPRGMASTNGSL